MKIKITEEYCSYFRRTNEYKIECEISKGKIIELSFCKWIVESDNETDNGTDFDETSQKIYDKLDEEQQIEIDDFLIELK